MLLGRDLAVMDRLRPMMALRTTKLGCPAHPLYRPADATPALLRSRRGRRIKSALRGAGDPISQR